MTTISEVKAIRNEFKVSGFLSLNGRVRPDGKVSVQGEARVGRRPYFFSLKARVGDAGLRIEPFSARWETWTGRCVRGRANSRLEELADAVVALVTNWKPDMSVFARNAHNIAVVKGE